MLSTLAKDVDAICGWSINDVVTESILKECRQAPKKDKVYFRSSAKEKLQFSQFSYTYDVHEPYFYCKNKKAYESYYAQSVLTLTEEVRLNKREKNKSYRRSPIVQNVESNKSKEEVMWRCVIPNYIPIPQVYSANQKETLDITYRGDHRYACSVVK